MKCKGKRKQNCLRIHSHKLFQLIRQFPGAYKQISKLHTRKVTVEIDCYTARKNVIVTVASRRSWNVKWQSILRSHLLCLAMIFESAICDEEIHRNATTHWNYRVYSSDPINLFVDCHKLFWWWSIIGGVCVTYVHGSTESLKERNSDSIVDIKIVSGYCTVQSDSI